MPTPRFQFVRILEGGCGVGFGFTRKVIYVELVFWCVVVSFKGEFE
jgi:hypothetical protein